MNEIHTLLIREVDKNIFEAIRNGTKTIETRAATEKYKAIDIFKTTIVLRRSS